MKHETTSLENYIIIEYGNPHEKDCKISLTVRGHMCEHAVEIIAEAIAEDRVLVNMFLQAVEQAQLILIAKTAPQGNA